MTEYTHSIVIAVPEHLTTEANQLALLLGEQSGDVYTFDNLGYTDGTTRYSVCATVVKPVFLEPTGTGVLPESDTVDMAMAQAAFAAIGTDIFMAVDVEPHGQLAEWGLGVIDAGE